jgi:hypothetical protein
LSVHLLKFPNGVILGKGATVKIEVVEIFTQYNAGWREVEFYGLEDLELLNQLVWSTGKDADRHGRCCTYVFSVYGTSNSGWQVTRYPDIRQSME